MLQFQFNPTITTKSKKLQKHISKINTIYKEVCSHIGVQPIKQIIDDSLEIQPNMQISNKNSYINWSYSDDTFDKKQYDYIVENINNHENISTIFQDVKRIYIYKDHIYIQKNTPDVFSDILSIEADVWPSKLCYNFTLYKLKLDIIPPYEVVDYR